MINNSYIISFDLETDSLDYINGEVVQISAVAVDPYKLEIVEGSEFDTLVKPVNILSGSEAEIQQKWNARQKAWDVNKKTRAQLEKAPLPQYAFKEFIKYVKRYDTGGRVGKPIAAGQNIQGFDLFWLDELSKRYKVANSTGKQNIFTTKVILDLQNIHFMWFENLTEPENLKLDTFRKFYGIEEQGHDSLVDCKTVANIVIRFLKLNRRLAPRYNFKGAFKNN